MDSSGLENSEAVGALNHSSGGQQDRLGKRKYVKHRPCMSQYLNIKHRPNQSVRPNPKDRPPFPNLSATSTQPTFSKGFMFSSLPPFSTQLQVRERAFLPYQPCERSHEMSTGQSTMTGESPPKQQPPFQDTLWATNRSGALEQPHPTQRPLFNDTTHFPKLIPVRRRAIPHTLRSVRVTEPSSRQSEIAAFREAMLRVPRNEQERREQDALMEAELDKVE
ncbi:hypothetical protein MMC15_000545 [Xylographa vitiligo]|nr:hypothetical protein [Xylographa vitiligo]